MRSMPKDLNAALNEYSKVSKESDVAFASPHRLIQMLMEGFLDKVAMARGAIARQDLATKGKQISLAVGILSGLRSSLDRETGGELAENLDNLYEYMSQQLLKANIENSTALIDETVAIMKNIKSGWDSIPEDMRQMSSLTATAEGAPGENHAAESAK